jgi:hypothetical protein
LFATVANGNVFRQLDASVGASGPHDFAVRKGALSSGAHLTSIASRPAFVTIANRPSVGRDGGGYAGDLRQKGTEIFLQRGLDMQITKQPVGQNHRFTGCEISRTVITGLDPVIHLLQNNFCEDGWMPGSSPGMTPKLFHFRHSGASNPMIPGATRSCRGS